MSANHRFSVPPVLLAILVQAVAWTLIGGFLVPFIGGHGVSVSPWLYALAAGIVAAVLSALAGLARWWWAIGLAFPPLVLATLELPISSGWFLAGFLILALMYWTTFRTQVPLYLSSRSAQEAVLALLPADSPFRFADLGCGLGSMVVYLGKMRPFSKFVGVETAPLPWLIARLRTQFLLRNCTIRWANLWATDLGGFDVVYAYLSPVPMADLWEKVRREMHPGSLFISNTFPVPGIEPSETVFLDEAGNRRLFIWRL